MGVSVEKLVQHKLDNVVCELVKLHHISHLKVLELLEKALKEFDMQTHWHMKHRIVCLQCGATADKKGSGLFDEAQLKYFENKEHWICSGCGSVYPVDYFDKKMLEDLKRLERGDA